MKKIARRSTRANLSDLQRFEVMILRKRRAAAARKLAFAARKASAPKGGKAAPAKGKK